jgi:NADH dehydrogenase FAD-containing subunit
MISAGGGEREIDYDDLVVALGSQPSTSAVPGVADNAITFSR